MDKYHLPPSHELFQNQSYAELMREMFEDLYAKKAEVEASLDSGELTGHAHQAAMEQLSSLCKALGEEQVRDDLVDQWERDLAEGRMPDLDAMPQQ